MKMEKRSKFQIYFDILLILCNQFCKTETDNELSPTRVAHKANLPYDRFRSYLGRLVQLGMVREELGEFFVTEKGLEYVLEYKRVTVFLERMGLL